ncbi:hypothetical protein HBH64_056450 [Parastagonospora nodorum]|nr:hypothetical protein HBH53_216370 [Parastagonospora nodorum]KAH3998110.1 hypothetical protein HBI10_129900 [Parastagonospora nodorum]KAH4030164.1 hypothetical protein HBI13_037680 [Parastagonospora nodorum]KAH4261152.1 hypothetical protein HBI03_122360 [Parastagonospora nodorum]KAH4281536.1 hypothetical protein HBI04_039730 [Parastagonospora nodorum]
MATIKSDPSEMDENYQNGSGSESKSPLAQFGFFKGLTEKKTTRDGQPAKRRGPKPDSKPALTRRQELNRQAQRTHRERKEMYIKALEQEVLRLKETFASTTRERDAFAEENRRLKELLMAHGIAFDLANPPNNGMPHVSSSTYGSSNGSVSGYGAGSASTGYTSPPSFQHRGSISHDSMGQPPMALQQQQVHQSGPQQNGLDYDQIGIDFVLTLERPCMDHMQFLMVRAHDAEETISGHALMATAPPDSHIAQCPEEKYPHQMPDITMPDLMKLLDLSNRLPLDGEITPIMAWAKIIQDANFQDLTKDEIEVIKTELLAKVRCYGFGAVLEEFEVSDALMTVLAGKYSNGNPTPTA